MTTPDCRLREHGAPPCRSLIERGCSAVNTAEALEGIAPLLIAPRGVPTRMLSGGTAADLKPTFGPM